MVIITTDYPVDEERSRSQYPGHRVAVLEHKQRSQLPHRRDGGKQLLVPSRSLRSRGEVTHENLAPLRQPSHFSHR